VNIDAVHLEWLQDKLAAYESKLAETEATIARLRPIVLNLRGTIDAIASEERGASPPKDLFGEQPATNGALNGASSPGPKYTLFTRGNKNPNMPERKAEFADRTLIDAAAQVINATPDTLHADSVIKAVFVIENIDQFKLAKHSMGSELHRGARRGLWQAVGGNRFRPK